MVGSRRSNEAVYNDGREACARGERGEPMKNAQRRQAEYGNAQFGARKEKGSMVRESGGQSSPQQAPESQAKHERAHDDSDRL